MVSPTDIGNSVTPVSPIASVAAVAPVADLRQESLSRLNQIAVGQQLQGQVLSQFNDGTFLVRLADTAARMSLAAGTKVGSDVILTLTSRDPRPTFTVTDHNGDTTTTDSVDISSEGAHSAGITQQTDKNQQLLRSVQQRLPYSVGEDPTIAADAKGNADGTQKNATTQLSTTGRMIDNLLQAAKQGDISNAIQAKTPLIAAANAGPVDTTKLTAALRETVNLSGVFYESHIAGWTEGKVTLTDLRREPQAQLGPQLQNGSSLLPGPEAGVANAQLGQIVNLQLNALEQQRIVWNGEVWPGQQMEWEVEKQEEDGSQNGQADGEAKPASWQTVVRFDFPNLGKVSAAIRLTGDKIHMQLRTQNDDATTTLRDHGEQLKNSLEAAGASLDAFLVKQDG
ncbi:flagellar hook-length control protein FliK [Herbaspirillum sp. RTI4]|uniref:flagellar hook-length control protein FliK n=1 Tax=Herbaspirillum sp. RTI4 TaxID=3048640 RepID=UPI002AB51B92|nr:flagellar hook-length control protein FliK [Herbaspirillum sp. RTI4]MDY7578323.1 flagellar hook-length control protein FliK [Herbaspirillum sp. RTI4]MEA9981184.1 flagellar hook-length control protein FliK [Herbaspirillum sp. RTI4]